VERDTSKRGEMSEQQVVMSPGRIKPLYRKNIREKGWRDDQREKDLGEWETVKKGNRFKIKR